MHGLAQLVLYWSKLNGDFERSGMSSAILCVTIPRCLRPRLMKNTGSKFNHKWQGQGLILYKMQVDIIKIHDWSVTLDSQVTLPNTFCKIVFYNKFHKTSQRLMDFRYEFAFKHASSIHCNKRSDQNSSIQTTSSKVSPWVYATKWMISEKTRHIHPMNGSLTNTKCTRKRSHCSPVITFVITIFWRSCITEDSPEWD